MSETSCNMCQFWLPELKECGNTHITKCVDKEHFVKITQRNCSICEEEIASDSIQTFALYLLQQSMLCDSFGQDLHDVYDSLSDLEIVDEIIKKYRETFQH